MHARARAKQALQPRPIRTYCIPVATSVCKPHNFKTEFNMLTSTKQISIAIAVTLALGMLSSPAFSASAPPNTTTQDQATLSLRSGNLVRLRSGGPLMTVVRIDGDQVNCVWTDWDGQFESGNFPIDVLQME